MTRPTKFLHTFTYIIAVFLISAVVFSMYLSINQLGGSGNESFPRMLNGTAVPPFIYRVLIPSLAKAGAYLMPQISDALKDTSPDTLIGRAIHTLSGERYFGEAFHALLLIYLSLAGFIFVERKFLHELGYPPELEFGLPVILALLVLPFSVHFAYVYDLPQMFLLSLGCLFLLKEQWAACLGTLAVSTLNKETSFFIIVIFAIYYFQRLPIKKFVTLLLLQVVIFAGIRAVITYQYRNNEGVSFFWSVNQHLAQYTSYPVTFVFTLMFFGMILYMIFKGWTMKPLFLRHASSVFFITFILFFLGGMPMEFRVFLDALPIFGIMLFPHRQELNSLLRENLK